MIRSQGLSSPFIFAVAYLYMSLINLSANLVQGTYTHVTVIPPASAATHTVSIFASPPVADVNISNQRSPEVDAVGNADMIASESLNSTDTTAQRYSSIQPEETTDGANSQPSPQGEDLTEEFNRWLQIHFPQIRIRERPALASVAYMFHYSIAIVVMLLCIWLMTGFNAGQYPSQVFLVLAAILDPALHILLGAAQMWKRRTENTCALGGLGVIVVKLLVWLVNMIGGLYAAAILFRVYEGIVTSKLRANFEQGINS
jgi:hypothetical protein